MIKNEREYRITKAQADKFRASIAAATDAGPPAKVHPRLHKASIDAMQAQLEELEHELAVYAKLQSGRPSLTGHASDLGSLLIRGRIARGWSQRELAERLGLHMQKIQQYEATEYASASVTRVREVLQALGLELDVRGTLHEFPAGLEEIGEPEKKPARANEKALAGHRR